jgi:hypothetical protein
MPDYLLSQHISNNPSRILRSEKHVELQGQFRCSTNIDICLHFCSTVFTREDAKAQFCVAPSFLEGALVELSVHFPKISPKIVPPVSFVFPGMRFV